MTERREGAGMFPAGLEQPEGSFRFSGDALLLADFAAALPLPENATIADLGTGCGVVALAVLRRKTLWRGVGLELQPELAAAARRNARRLGVEDRFCVLEGDVGESARLREMRAVLSEGKDEEDGVRDCPLFDAVFCNPPWRRQGAGRLPPSAMRRAALFGTERTFPTFFSAADGLLKNGGRLAVVSGADRTADLLAALPVRMRPERLCFVFTRRAAPAAFALLLARKNGRAALRVDKLELEGARTAPHAGE